MTAIVQTSVAAAPAKRAPNRAWRKLKANKGALVGLAIILFFAALAILAPVLPLPDPIATSWSAIRKAPSAAHWLGTDDIGRDILSRMIWGAQASLMAGIFSVAIAVAIGVPFGLISGYYGGWIDQIVSRITEAFLAMPFLITAIALAAFLGPSLTNAMIAIGLSATPVFVRLTRGQVLAVKTEEYVEGARSIGLQPFQHHHPLHPAERFRADSRAGNTHHRNGDHRRGQPLFPWPRPATAGP